MNHAQLEFLTTGGAPTQAQIILDVLTRHRGDWVSMPDLARESGAYAVHSRAAELRGKGHTILQKCVTEPISKRRHSFYMIPA